jgi:UDP-glucose 4-epimerase
VKILVTGGAGFIGSHVVDAYQKLGHSIAIIDDLSTGRERNINAHSKFYRVDIRNSGEVEEILKRERFDLINHHAAQMDVRRSVTDPAYDASVNIIGALNLLESAVKTGV